MANVSYSQPGRLGNPDMSLETDPRTSPNILKALRPFGLGGNVPVSKLPETWSIESLTDYVAKSDAAIGYMYESIENDLPTDANEPAVDISEKTIKGVDNNDVKLYIYKPAGTKDPLPAVLYSHGGGMVSVPMSLIFSKSYFLQPRFKSNTLDQVINPTTAKPHRRWVQSLAVQGVVAILVDFRNAYTAAGHNPFPAGLNDCASAAQYVAAHKADLGVSSIVLQGESGGGNLAIATAMKANREGWVEQIDGVYGIVPYVSGAYHWPRERMLKELPSLIENDGYLLGVQSTGAMAYYYGPDDLENPHAWPYHATVEELRGLPPVMLDMNELDPLRDEGLVLYRKLGAAGVQVSAKVTAGVPHGASLVFRKEAPEVHNAAVRDIVAFAKSLEREHPKKLSVL
jgi:acetyl esterase/lipase